MRHRIAECPSEISREKPGLGKKGCHKVISNADFTVHPSHAANSTQVSHTVPQCTGRRGCSRHLHGWLGSKFSCTSGETECARPLARTMATRLGSTDRRDQYLWWFHFRRKDRVAKTCCSRALIDPRVERRGAGLAELKSGEAILVRSQFRQCPFRPPSTAPPCLHCRSHLNRFRWSPAQ